MAGFNVITEGLSLFSLISAYDEILKRGVLSRLLIDW
jgi:hypothetical protein